MVLWNQLSGSVMHLTMCSDMQTHVCARQRNDWLQHKAECQGIAAIQPHVPIAAIQPHVPIAAIQPHVPTDTMRLVVRALQKNVRSDGVCVMCGTNAWYVSHVQRGKNMESLCSGRCSLLGCVAAVICPNSISSLTQLKTVWV